MGLYVELQHYYRDRWYCYGKQFGAHSDLLEYAWAEDAGRFVDHTIDKLSIEEQILLSMATDVKDRLDFWKRVNHRDGSP